MVSWGSGGRSGGAIWGGERAGKSERASSRVGRGVGGSGGWCSSGWMAAVRAVCTDAVTSWNHCVMSPACVSDEDLEDVPKSEEEGKVGGASVELMVSWMAYARRAKSSSRTSLNSPWREVVVVPIMRNA